MKRGTIVLVIFGVIAAIVVGVSVFLQNQPPIEITIAVDPLAEDWVRDAADAFNDTDTLVNGTRRIQVNVTTISDLDVWRSTRTDFWTAENHPTGWIPASSASVDYATGANLPIDIVVESTARTLLVWGGYSARVNLLTNDGTTTLDWADVVLAAETEAWSELGGSSGFVNLALLLPDRTMGGLASLFSAAATFNDSATITNGAVRDSDFYAWLEPVINSVQNFNTIGSDIAQFTARGGTNSVDIAIGPEVQWLNGLDGIIRNAEMQFSYPAYNVIFDFPVAMWEDAATTSDERAGVRAFGEFLQGTGQQQNAVNFGLRPITGNPPATAPLFVAGAEYGIQIDAPITESVTSPSATDVQSLLQWFGNAQRR